MPHDLTAALQQMRQGQTSASAMMSQSLSIARSPACASAFVRLFAEPASAQADCVDRLVRAGAPLPPLAGLAVSIKDLFDVAGHPTTAASASLRDAAPAAADAPAVARLRQAGAALLGHTHMSEFAFSGVGINPHHGTPGNPVTHALDGRTRIPGGSSSGAAVSVATGAAWAALGSDTGGSLRIPAALQGLVGFKCSAQSTPREGCIPLSTSLDTVGAITRSVRDARLLHHVLAAQPAPTRIAGRPLADLRLAVVRELMQDELEPGVAMAFERALALLRAAGARIAEVSLAEAFVRLPALQAQGGLTAAEAWAWHRRRLAEREALYDPRVALRIRRGESISAADYIDLLRERRLFIAQMHEAIAGFDALLSPTVPMHAPELAPLLESDALFFATNARLLRNPAIVNLLDGCAISLPCEAPGELPVGLMAWTLNGRDDALLGVADQLEAALAPTTGRGVH